MEKKQALRRKIILVPVDFSAPSERALKQIAAYCSTDAEWILFHVCNRNPEDSGDSGQNRYKLFSRYIKILNTYDCTYHLVVQGFDGCSSAADAILAFAKARKTDLIAIGAHGGQGISCPVMGSTAETVLRFANCPVLLIKTLDEEDTEKEAERVAEGYTTADSYWL
jgi:universal stress protein A